MSSFVLNKYFKFLKYYLIANFFNKNKVHKSNKETILYFLPEAGLDEYVKIQIKIAKFLQNLDYNIVLVRCQKIFNKCQLKNSLGINYSHSLRNKILGNLTCEFCLGKSIEKLNKLNFSVINLNIDKNSINKNDIQDEYFQSDNIRKFIKYKYCGLSIAKLVLYDFFLETKKTNLKNITSQDIAQLKLYVISAIRAIEALKKIKDDYNFEYIFLRDEFSMSSVINLWCRTNKIKVFRVEGAYLYNHSMEYISFLNTKSIFEERKYLERNWSHFKDLPLKKNVVNDLYNDLIFRMTTSGGHIFSRNYDKNLGKKIFEYLKIKKNKKILVAYTSSIDEIEASRINKQVFKLNFSKIDIFNSQLDWIKKTIHYVEKKSSKFQLIIKIHPRSAGNLDEMQIYKNYFEGKNFNNVRIIYPEEKISSFNIAEIADLALVSWSNIALELTRLGIPVLSGYQSDANIIPKVSSRTYLFAKNKKDYFKKINLMSNFIPSISDIIENLRWCSYLYLGNTVNVKNFHYSYNNFNKNKCQNLIKKLLHNNTCVIDEALKEKNIKKNNNKKDIYSEKASIEDNLKKLSIFFNNFRDSKFQQRMKYIIK
jgi:hypothetical protein